ncbi:pseudouridine synthase [Chitinibacteraceae bacterium HSL-7]
MKLELQTPDRAAVLWQGDDFVVGYKPAGLSFHREGDADGLVELLRADCQRALWPVHRLDRVTSGLVLAATSAEAAAQLGARFAARQMDKFYLAIASGKPAKKQGTVAGGMVAARGGSYRLTREAGGQFAATQFFSYGLGGGSRLYLLRPLTGRTHQLRVMMKSLGAPILGDARYGGGTADRAYLHAWWLAFDWCGERVEFRLDPADGLAFAAAHDAVLGLPDPMLLSWPSYSLPDGMV